MYSLEHVTTVAYNYWRRMCKFESLQKDESGYKNANFLWRRRHLPLCFAVL